ncbi:hypothetical protein RhiTH_001378 [Rhizoctonia solani]
MSIVIAVIMVLDYLMRSPLNVSNEAILYGAAGLIDLISAVATLFFTMDNSICKVRPRFDFWNTCGAHFAVVILLWTSTFLLVSYAICLAFIAKRYSQLHPLDKESVWNKKVKQVSWSRTSYSPQNLPGRRLQKRGPLDIESLRRVVADKDSRTLSRQMGYSYSSPLPATPSRPIGRPPGLDSPVGFAERMGYFRREAQGEYVPSTPTLRQEPSLGHPHRVPAQEVERGAVFRMQTPGVNGIRRPSFPDLPNPFPLPHASHGSTQPIPITVEPAPRSWTPSHSSANSNGSSPGFAGLGAGSEPEKGILRISPPAPLGSPRSRGTSSPRTELIQGARNSVFIHGQQRPSRVSAPFVPVNTPPLSLPRHSLQPIRPLNLPSSPRSNQPTDTQHLPSYPRKYSLPHSPLATAVPKIPAPAAYRSTSLSSSQIPSNAGHPYTSTTPVRPLIIKPTLTMLPPVALSPSTKQRVSNPAYPLPLPPLSTYPIKSVAGSVRPSTQELLKGDSSSFADGSVQRDMHGMKERPLSAVSTVSYYSTSSASHGPQPVREYLLSLASPSGTQMGDSATDESLQRSDSALSRRSSKSKKAPTVTRSSSRHGPAPQNLWGGTGNGPTRHSLASQFQRPQVRRVLDSGGQR